MLRQCPTHLHIPVHGVFAFLQLHLSVMHVPLQLHLIKFTHASGTGDKDVRHGTSFPVIISEPYSVGSGIIGLDCVAFLHIIACK